MDKQEATPRGVVFLLLFILNSAKIDYNLQGGYDRKNVNLPKMMMLFIFCRKNKLKCVKSV